MQDIAISTGAEFISEDLGVTLENANLECLGSAKQVIISKDDTIIMGGGGQAAEVSERVDVLSRQQD